MVGHEDRQAIDALKDDGVIEAPTRLTLKGDALAPGPGHGKKQHAQDNYDASHPVMIWMEPGCGKSKVGVFEVNESSTPGAP